MELVCVWPHLLNDSLLTWYAKTTELSDALLTQVTAKALKLASRFHRLVNC